MSDERYREGMRVALFTAFFITAFVGPFINPAWARSETVSIESYYYPTGSVATANTISVNKGAVGQNYRNDNTLADNNLIVEGKLGIGTPNPVATLDLAGSLYTDGGSGDVDESGSVAMNDQVLLGRYLTGLSNLTRQQLAKADVNGDGTVDYIDYNIVAALALGFPKEDAEVATARIAYPLGSGGLSNRQWVNRTFYVDGNVGIGTTNPNFVVAGGSRPILTVHGATADNEGVIQASVASATGTNPVGSLLFVSQTGGAFYSSVVGYRDNADNSIGLRINTSNAGSVGERMRITSAGKVGIGTTPAYPLHVYQNNPNDGAGVLKVEGNATGQSSILLTNSSPGGNEWRFDSMGSGSGWTGGLAIRTGALWSPPPFFISGTSGNVGIGTSSPRSKLHVAGPVLITGTGANAGFSSAQTIGGSRPALITYAIDPNDSRLVSAMTLVPPTWTEPGKMEGWSSQNGGSSYVPMGGGGRPDYDSDWVYDSYYPTHWKDFYHGFGQLPTRVEVWFSPNPYLGANTEAYPVSMMWYNSYNNPLSVRVTPYYVRLAIYQYYPLHGEFDLTSNWRVWYSGYWRVVAWK